MAVFFRKATAAGRCPAIVSTVISGKLAAGRTASPLRRETASGQKLSALFQLCVRTIGPVAGGKPTGSSALPSRLARRLLSYPVRISHHAHTDTHLPNPYGPCGQNVLRHRDAARSTGQRPADPGSTGQVRVRSPGRTGRRGSLPH